MGKPERPEHDQRPGGRIERHTDADASEVSYSHSDTHADSYHKRELLSGLECHDRLQRRCAGELQRHQLYSRLLEPRLEPIDE